EEALGSRKLCGMLGVANRRAETLGLLDRKRIELARALAARPTLLLLYEIGGGLTDGEPQADMADPQVISAYLGGGPK
ncbi:MAG: ABC transporter ATP-binding protein, partial [Mesorhizobium sp.]|nr:ABC transporter ATP-binding protein [Mesorhizobium sp.]